MSKFNSLRRIQGNSIFFKTCPMCGADIEEPEEDDEEFEKNFLSDDDE